MFVLQSDFRCTVRADVHTKALLMMRVFWDVVRLKLLFLEDERITIPRNDCKSTQTQNSDTASKL
jgi:hypothetical protein